MSNQIFRNSLESVFTSLSNETSHRDIGFRYSISENQSITPLKEKYENINQLNLALVSKLSLEINNHQSITQHIKLLIEVNENLNQVLNIFNHIFIEISTSIIKSNFNKLIITIQLIGLLIEEIGSNSMVKLFIQIPELNNQLLDQLSSIYLYLLNNENPLIRFININQRNIFINTISSYTYIFNKNFNSFYSEFIKIKSSFKSNYLNLDYIKNNIYEDQHILKNIKFYCN